MEEYLNKLKTIQSTILDYIDDENESEDKFQDLDMLLKDWISDNEENLEVFFHLITKIYSNHHQNSNLITKIEKILLLLREDISKKVSNSKIMEIFCDNKRILLFLITENLFNIDESFISKFNSILFSYAEHFLEYFAPEIKSYIESTQNIDQNNFYKNLYNKVSNELPENFYENRLRGENEDFIFNLIRNDMIDEFVKHVNKTNLSLESKIKDSIYETNSFLLYNRPKLIEYAAFYGSIQIYQYLRLNNVELDSSLWLYAIHGRNSEIIHLLEYDQVKPFDISYNECYKESIKCFHNDIANYIKDSLLNDNGNKNEINFQNGENSVISLIYHNYEFIPDNLDNIKYAFFYLCNYKLFSLARIYLMSKNIDESFLFKIDDYECIEKLGNGCLGDSFIVKNKTTNKKFVVKSSEIDFNECQHDEYIQILNQNKSPDILSIVGYSPINFDHKSKPTILIDYFPNGSLEKYLKEKMNDKLSTIDYILILGIAIGLKHLQNRNIVYIVFHPRNILLNENFYPIISDFIVSYLSLFSYLFVHNVEFERTAYLPPGTPDDLFTYSSNIASYSLILYHILTRKCPIRNSYQQDVFENSVKNNDFDNCLDFSLIHNQNIINFIIRCIRANSEKKSMQIDEIIDFITSDNFYSYFGKLDIELIVKYLNTFGDEFCNLKSKFRMVNSS
ncbi:hypothetical protein M9Y10_040573 [Tritrichomonas musculus]|uniref:Protein kinase domain-containing protein n=1 Tax=Tritrichomonas musculus TaxID=1915356 RepID=A0ABR2GP73_9EUKA